MVRKEVWLEPRSVKAPTGARISKKRKIPLFSKKKLRREGFICAPRVKHGTAPYLEKGGIFYLKKNIFFIALFIKYKAICCVPFY